MPGMSAVFLQIIQARAADRDALRDHYQRWFDDLAPGADGWLGATAGVTDDGEFIAIVRFASAEAARRNSQRPEQDEWWQQLVDHLDGEPTVHDCAGIAEIAGGGSDDAGFVQVFQGRAPDLADVLDKIEDTSEAILPHRAELIGGYVAAHGEGDGFTEVLYYPSQQAAQNQQAADVREEELTRVAEMTGTVTDLRRFDLDDPWLDSA